MVKIRLEGTSQECQQAAPRLAEVFEVVSISQPSPNRGCSLLVRVYVEVRLAHQRDINQDDATARRGPRLIGPGGSCPSPDL
ncbi:MAG TPA: hypothetical protein VGC06_14605 [Actinomycetes bacterium]